MATILVTRPEKDGERAAEKLRRAGHEVIFSPVLAIHPVEAALPIGPVDALFVTSANAAGWLAQPEVRTILSEKSVFAVGDQAAAAVRAAGYATVRSASGSSRELVDLVATELAPPAHLLAPLGRAHREEPIEALRAHGFDVARLIVYDATPVEHLTAEAIAGLRYEVIDAALHYSPRSAQSFVDLAQRAGASDNLQRLRHFCLSREVAVALPDNLRQQTIVAAEPNEDALIAALTESFSASPVAAAIAQDEGASPPREKRRPPRPRSPRIIEGEAMRLPDSSERDEEEAASAAETSVAAAALAPPPSPRVEQPVEEEASAVKEAAEPMRRAKENPAPQAESRSPGDSPQISDPRSAPHAAPQPGAPPRRRAPFLAALFGGVVAGAVAGLAAAFLAPSLFMRAPEPSPPPSIDSTAIDARFAALAPRTDLVAQQQAIDGVAAAIARDRAALRAELDALKARADQLSSAAPPAPSSAGVDPDMKSRLDSLVVSLAPSLQALGARLQALEGRITEAERALAARPAAASSSIDSPARRHAIAATLTQSLARGAPYGSELSALQSLGASPAQIAALQPFAERGAPSARALADEFKPLIPNLLPAQSAPPSAPFGERLLASLRGLVRIRPLGQALGDDPAALVARIEAALARGAFIEAQEAFAGLPETQRAPAAEWGRRLQQRAAAAAAAQALAEESTRALADSAK